MDVDKKAVLSLKARCLIHLSRLDSATQVSMYSDLGIIGNYNSFLKFDYVILSIIFSESIVAVYFLGRI